MASAAGTFEPIIGAYFDDKERPFLELQGSTEEEIQVRRAEYVMNACDDPKLVEAISDYYGVSII